jgi:quercetin dioxygenase-like cupin family protein
VNITRLLKKATCTLMPADARTTSTGNSVLTVGYLVNLADGLFPDPSIVKMTASLVEIRGQSEEDMHYHTSHIVGIVVHGSGYLRVPEGKLPAKKGDMVIIPRKAMHYFDCDPDGELTYVSLEVSDTEIDYQKHFRSDELVFHSGTYLPGEMWNQPPR